MRWGRSMLASAIVVACTICAPATAQVFDQPGGDLQWVRRVPLASSVPGAKTVNLKGASADAVYSNLGTFQNQSFAAGGATQQVLNTITRMAADDLNLVGTPPYSVNGFRFTVTNLNAVDVSASPLVRFYLPDGPGGGPGTLIAAFTYNPIVFTAGRVGTIKTSTKFVLQSSSIWAGIVFDNNGGTTGATAAQLDNLAQGIFSPPELGTSTDRYFVTTAAGSFASDNPVGTITNFGGAPPADFGWEILTAQDVDLSITNTDGVATTYPGGSVVYTITATNAGPDTVFEARVVDAFPAPLTCSWTCAGSAGNTCAASGVGNINDATVDLAVGGSVTYTATCAVSPAAAGTLVNTATVFAPGTAVEANIADNSATDSDAIVPGPDLTIAKSHTGNFTQGQPGTYSLTVSNAGGSPTSGSVTVTDNVPIGLVPTSAVGTGWSCNVAGQGAMCNRSDPLAPGASYPPIALTVAVEVNAPASVTNTAVVFGGGETDPSNSTAADPTAITAGPDLTITKSHSGNFTQGQTGTYTLTVSNIGGSPTSGSVTVTDNFPLGLVPTSEAGAGWACTNSAQGVTCTRNDALGPGQSYPAITLTVSVQPDAPASVTNTAVVFGGGGTNALNNTSSDPTTITAGPDLAIAKSHTGNFTQGQTGATYTITVSNAGVGPTSGAVTVTDNVPIGLVPTSAVGTGWSCNIAAQGVTCNRSDAVAPGQSYPAITLTINVQPNAPASVANIATVTGGGDVNSGNNSASDATTIIAVADLTLTKAHTGNFLQGQIGATYTLTVSNIGSGPSSGTVTLTDTVPAGLTPTAAAGTGWTCNIAGQVLSCTRADVLNVAASYPAITLTVNVAPAAPPSLTNTATVTGGGEINTANSTASDVTTIGPGADLTIAKSHTGNFTQGQIGATYTITVSNHGAAPTSGLVTVTDSVPAGLLTTSMSGSGWTCTIPTVTCTRSDPLAPGQSYPITLTVDVQPSAPGSVTNAVTVTGGGDVNAANNSATDVATIIPGADLTITKSHAGNFTQGQTGATYTVTVTNAGTAPTTATVTVTDTLPLGLAPTAATGAGWSCSTGTQAVVCSRSDVLAAGASYPPITITLNVASNAPPSVTNVVGVSGGGGSNPANNTASDLTTILPGPDLTIAKSHTGNFIQGQPGAYSLIVSNAGGSPTSGSVTVTDNVPIGLVPTSAAGAGWTCSIAGQGAICNRSDPLAPGASYPPIALMVAVEVNAPASVINTAIVFGGGEINPSNNTSADPTTIAAGPDLTITKRHTGNFTQGQAGTYTLAVSNTGGSPTRGSVTVTDNVPIGLVPTSAAGAGWTCNIASQGAICNRSDPLAPGASYPPITLTVAVEVKAPVSVTNTAVVFGGGETNPSNNTAADPTAITAGPDLTITKSHAGNFTQGQTGTYALTVSNTGGLSTDGPVTITDNVPIGLVPTSAAGAGWTCSIAGQDVTCSRSDALPAGSSYPPVTLTVNVALTAPPTITNIATVSGGGDATPENATASDVTTIVAAATATATATVIPTLRGPALAVLLLLIAAIGAAFLRVRARVRR